MLIKGEDTKQILRNILDDISKNWKGLPNGLPYELIAYDKHDCYVVYVPYLNGKDAQMLNMVSRINGYEMYIHPMPDGLKINIKKEK